VARIAHNFVHKEFTTAFIVFLDLVLVKLDQSML